MRNVARPDRVHLRRRQPHPNRRPDPIDVTRRRQLTPTRRHGRRHRRSGNGIAIWDLNPEHLAAAACRLAGRNLTPTEWDTHLAELGDYRPTCPQYL